MEECFPLASPYDQQRHLLEDASVAAGTQLILLDLNRDCEHAPGELHRLVLNETDGRYRVMKALTFSSPLHGLVPIDTGRSLLLAEDGIYTVTKKGIYTKLWGLPLESRDRFGMVNGVLTPDGYLYVGMTGSVLRLRLDGAAQRVLSEEWLRPNQTELLPAEWEKGAKNGVTPKQQR